MPLAQALEYAKLNRPRYLSELKDFIAIPSISTLPERKGDIQRAAEWLAHELTSIGLHAEIIATNGHPVVYGERLGTPGNSTVLIYGHYDVQPVDPLEEWVTPPFEPMIHGEDIFGRGASDMKGNAHAVIKALEARITSGDLAVNVKVLFEGEEEIGSPNLETFMIKYKDKLSCDCVLNTDSGILRPDLPSLAYGLRGLVCFEILVRGPKNDLHSGTFGGSVHNPGQVLSDLIANMHDRDGRVTLPGFYDRVRTLSNEERTELASIPHSDRDWRELTGVPQLWGERGFSTLERIGTRPTLEINGLLAGFTGEGVKTVLPARAIAKISMRIVPDQDDEAVYQQLKEYMRKNAPPTITWEIRKLESEAAVILDRNTPAMRAASASLEATFGVKPVFDRKGESIGVPSLTKKILGKDSVLMGFSLPDDNAHAPNEKLHLPNYYRGIETYIRFFDLISAANSPGQLKEY
jgi:acetylornithine deacetylase/succinyl-diaminopimelate desuccinylase-like protein